MRKSCFTLGLLFYIFLVYILAVAPSFLLFFPPPAMLSVPCLALSLSGFHSIDRPTASLCLSLVYLASNLAITNRSHRDSFAVRLFNDPNAPLHVCPVFSVFRYAATSFFVHRPDGTTPGALCKPLGPFLTRISIVLDGRRMIQLLSPSVLLPHRYFRMEPLSYLGIGSDRIV